MLCSIGSMRLAGGRVVGANDGIMELGSWLAGCQVQWCTWCACAARSLGIHSAHSDGRSVSRSAGGRAGGCNDYGYGYGGRERASERGRGEAHLGSDNLNPRSRAQGTGKSARRVARPLTLGFWLACKANIVSAAAARSGGVARAHGSNQNHRVARSKRGAPRRRSSRPRHRFSPSIPSPSPSIPPTVSRSCISNAQARHLSGLIARSDHLTFSPLLPHHILGLRLSPHWSAPRSLGDPPSSAPRRSADLW